MCVQCITLLVLAFCQVPPSSQAPISKEKLQDVRSFKATELHIQEKNATLTICSPGGLDFHLVLEDGSVKHHRIDDQLSDCQRFKIASVSNQIHIEKGMDRVKTFNDSVVKEVFIKSESNDTIWKFFEPCSEEDTGVRLCRVTCPESQLCREYITCTTDDCSNLDTGTIYMHNLMWFVKDVLPFLFTIPSAAFLVMLLFLNCIKKVSKTRKYDEVLQV